MFEREYSDIKFISHKSDINNVYIYYSRYCLHQCILGWMLECSYINTKILNALNIFLCFSYGLNINPNLWMDD
jgi:hypothetical protein